MAKREPADVSRRRTLDAAARRFGELGFERTRVEDVAADVGLGRSGVLYHFQSKRRLYDAVLDDLYGDLLAKQRAILTARGSVAERVERSIVALIDSIVGRPALAQIALQAAATTDPEQEKDARTRALPFAELIAGLIEPEVDAAGAALGVDYRLLASTIVGTVLYYVSAIPTFLGPQTDDHLAPERIEALKRTVVRNALQTLELGS